MNTPRFKLTDLVFAAMLLVVIAVALRGCYNSMTRFHRYAEARRIRCRNNLKQLGYVMVLYLNDQGARWYSCPLGRGTAADDYNGAEWLASLYWTGYSPDPGIFICPSSPDTNDNGEHLGKHRASPSFGSQTVSYAAMHYRSLTGAAGAPRAAAIPHDFPPNMPMACDDTQGTVNHGHGDGGMAVLFFDGHVEFKTVTEVDLERGVGRKGGLLWQLRN